MASSSFRVFFYITRQSFIFVSSFSLSLSLSFSYVKLALSPWLAFLNRWAVNFIRPGYTTYTRKERKEKNIKLMQHESALRPFDANAHNSFYLVVTFFFFIFFILFMSSSFPFFFLLLLFLLHHFIFLLQNVLLPGCNCKFIITISYLRAIACP